MGDAMFTRRFNIQELVLDGSSQELAGTSALEIKNLTGTNDDGYYWINLGNGQGPQEVYCIMNGAVDGGGWMMLWSAPTGVSMSTSTRFTANRQSLPTTSMPYNLYSLDYGRRSGVKAICTQNQTLFYAGVNNWLRAAGTLWNSATHNNNSGQFRFRFNSSCVTSNGTTDTSISLGATNYGIDGGTPGGDMGIDTRSNGFDNHASTSYYFLNSSCVNHYLYQYGYGYKVNTGLSGWWTNTTSCSSVNTNSLAFAVLMR